MKEGLCYVDVSSKDVSLVIDGSDSYQQLHFSKMFTHTHNVPQLHMGTLKIKTKRLPCVDFFVLLSTESST